MAGLQKVRPGDRLQISAETFNTLVDAGRDLRGRQHDLRRPARTPVQQAATILISNETVTGLDRWETLAVTSPLIDPSDNELAFGERIAMTGAAPATSGTGTPAVLVDPLGAGAIGRAVVHGLAIARVVMAAESHSHADLAAGTTRLVSATAGPAELLWVQPADDRPEPGIVALCIVRLGSRSSAGTLRSALITSKAGSISPYRYAAIEAVMDVDGVWSAVADGTVYNNVFAQSESGSGGEWAGPFTIGDPVALYPAPGGADAWVAIRDAKRGTYN